MSTTAGIYARFCTDKQRDASINDRFREREHKVISGGRSTKQGLRS